MAQNVIFLFVFLFAVYVILITLIAMKFHTPVSHELARPIRSAPIYTSSSQADPDIEFDVNIDSSGRLAGSAGSVNAEIVVRNSDRSNSYEYAFYLIINDEKVDARWYESNSKVEFLIPENAEKIEISAFVKDVHGNRIGKKVPVASNLENAKIENI